MRDERVVRIDGSRRNPVTQGFICAKVRGYADHLYGSERLRFPAVRRGAKGEGRFERVSWDEALGLVSDAAAGHPRALRGRGRPAPLLRRLERLPLPGHDRRAAVPPARGLASHARGLRRAHRPRRGGALRRTSPGVAYDDYAHARLIVMWGANPTAAGVHLVPYVYEAQRRGARLVVVDPRRTPLARRADLHLAVRPGTDLCLALAVIRWLFGQRPGRRGVPGRAHDGLARAAAPGRGLDPREGGGRHRPRGRGDRSLRPAVRRVAAGRGALRLGAGAQPQRRLGGGGGDRPARGGGEVRRAGRRLHPRELAGLGPVHGGRHSRPKRPRRARST